MNDQTPTSNLEHPVGPPPMLSSDQLELFRQPPRALEDGAAVVRLSDSVVKPSSLKLMRLP